MSKVLITGGAGFIGAHVAKALMKDGATVTLYDNMNDFLYEDTFKRDRIEHMFLSDDRPQLIIGDILDSKLLRGVFEEGQFDTVIHLAALANPGVSLDAAEVYTAVNVMGSLNVLELVRDFDIPQLIVAGSSSVYNDEQTPFVEDSYPLRPRSPYGASKAAMETYCRLWHDLYQTRITILRFFSVYGPWGRPDMAPHIFTDHILNDTELELSQGRQRDFTYIDDIVAGVVATVEAKLDFDIINLGRGQAQSLESFVQAIETASGKQTKITPRTPPPGEMAVTFANIDKARTLLGYEPKVSIEEGAKKLVEWYKETQI